MNTFQLELLELTDIYLSILHKKRVKPRILCNQLKYKNPLEYQNLTPTRIKKALGVLYPNHKNRKKGTKIFTLSSKKVLKLRKKKFFRLKPLKDVNTKFYGINKDRTENG